MKKITLIVTAVLLVFALAAPIFAGGKQEKEAAGGEAEEQVKIAYVCKMLTHPWFQEEEKGAEEKAEELGVEYFGIDANLDDEAFMQECGKRPCPGCRRPDGLYYRRGNGTDRFKDGGRCGSTPGSHQRSL